MSIENKIKNIMVKVLKVDMSDIKDSASTETLSNWDSINHLNLLMALEYEFNIKFSDEELVSLASFAELYSAINSKFNIHE